MEAQPDFKELLALFNAHKVKYVIVGAYALAFYGIPRMTGDIDIFVQPSLENSKKIITALKNFGFGSLGLTPGDFQKPDTVIQLGMPPVRIDLLTSLTGVTWTAAQKSRVKGHYGGIPVHYIGQQQLTINKKKLGRNKDKADLDALGTGMSINKQNKFLKTIIILLGFYCFGAMAWASDLDVSGIFLDKNRGNTALVNNTVVSVGDTVDGVKVVDITEKGVIFSQDGQQFLQDIKTAHYETQRKTVTPASSASSASTQADTAHSTPSNTAKAGPRMKTLYGMPINKFFPDEATVKKEIADAIPPSSPAEMLQRADAMKAKADAKRAALEARVKEAEGN